MKAAGTYQFSLLHSFKGAIDSVFNVNLPAILKPIYSDSEFPIVPGQDFVLLLRKAPDGTLVLADLGLPLIPIDSQQSEFEGFIDADNGACLIDMLARSMKDPSLRPAISSVLRSVVSDDIVSQMYPYLHDPNILTRDNILTCFGINQQVAAIPLIDQIEHDLVNRYQGCNCVSTLSNYDVADAVPLLNPLVFDRDYYVRKGAIYALVSLADLSSIPYYVLAMRDPDPSYAIQGAAQQGLISSIPAMDAYANQVNDQFIASFRKESEIVNGYWAGYLLGEDLPRSSHADLLSEQKVANEAIPLKLNATELLLFQPYPSLRERAITTLESRADRSSVPFLVLGLQDPDHVVSYESYVILRRLIGVPRPPMSSDAYFADKASATEPLYSWWSDELLGKHIKRAQ